MTWSTTGGSPIRNGEPVRPVEQRSAADHDQVIDEELLLRNARLRSGGQALDLLISAGRLAVRPTGSVAGRQSVDLDGRLVLPGLSDSHVHFDQWAAAGQRLDVSGAQSAAALTTLVAQRIRREPAPAGTVLLGYGFRDGLWPDRPTAAALDAVAPDSPVVIVSADLHSAWMNSIALQRFHQIGHPTGLLRESEWIPVMNEVGAVPEPVGDAWAELAARTAAARGVVGIVDFELPDNSMSWGRRIAAGTRSLRVTCSVWPERLDDAIARGLRSGDPIPGTDALARMGPLKVISDGSLNTRTAYCHDPYPGLHGLDACGVLTCPPAVLVPLMRRAWAAGLNTSIHAIGDRANSLVLDAFEAVGSRGTIEHAQLLDEADLGRFAALDITASVQPQHALDDRDVADQHWAGRTGRAFPYGALLRAGARLTLGSDAPVAPLDPWITIAAAVCRTKDDRRPWHPEHQLAIGPALAASTGGRLVIENGDVADLVILNSDPFTADVGELRTMQVAGTMLRGGWTHRSGL